MKKTKDDYDYKKTNFADGDPNFGKLSIKDKIVTAICVLIILSGIIKFIGWISNAGYPSYF